MGALLDVFFAAIIAALLMVNVADTNDDLLTMQHRNTLQYALQSNSSQLQQLLLRDLRMAGYGTGDQTGVIRADSATLELRGDFLRDGGTHIVRYSLDAPGSATTTPHSQDRLLWRSLDDRRPEAFAFGLIDLRFAALDSAGQSTADSSLVRQVRYEYALESTVPLSDRPPALYVSGAMTPKNLR